MVITSILTHTDCSAEPPAHLQCAVDLARRFQAVLIGLGAEAIPAKVVGRVGEVIARDMITVLLETIDEDLKEARALFERATPGIETHWVSGRGSPGALMCEICAQADLLVVSAPPPSKSGGWSIADTGELIVRSGRPCLVVPPEKPHLSGDRVVVAWKNTTEARRAVAAALPFLMTAQDVLLLMIGEPESRAHEVAVAQGVATNLRRHGVAVRVEWEGVSPKAPVTEQILNHARWMGADLIVAGGYGHSRIGERILGGVTHKLLHQTERFVLFSH